MIPTKPEKIDKKRDGGKVVSPALRKTRVPNAG
jgi:hypothetical protein